MSNDKKPAIRFKDYSDDWEQRKLENILSLENGFAFQSEYFVEEKTGYVVATPGNVSVEGGFICEGGKNYSVSAPFNERFIFKSGDIFVTMTDLTPTANTLGKPAIVPDNGIIYLHNQRLGKLVDYNCNKKFLFALLCTDKYHSQIVKTASGTTVRHSSPDKILSYETFVPKFEEQKMIGKFFSNLDHFIALHQRKYDKLQNLKKAMLKKMFPKNSSNVPEIRFKGFTDAWEQRKLGELAEIVGGGTPSTGIDSYWDGDIDWYAPAEIGEQIYLESSQRKITEEGLNKSSAKILPIGTVLFTSRAGIGKTAILLKEGCTNQGFQSIVPNKEKLDSYFIFTRSEELKRYGETVGAGSTFVEVSGKQMANMELMMPKTMLEQQQIGEYFQSLDHLITLHQRELEKLKNIKKAMLEKMFV